MLTRRGFPKQQTCESWVANGGVRHADCAEDGFQRRELPLGGKESEGWAAGTAASGSGRDLRRGIALAGVGQRLPLAGENVYRAQAYTRDAQSVLTLTVPLNQVIASNR